MADINQVISLGIGSPADIPHFILVGLSPTGVVAVIAADPMVVRVSVEDRRVRVSPDRRCVRVTEDEREIEVGAKPWP